MGRTLRGELCYKRLFLRLFDKDIIFFQFPEYRTSRPEDCVSSLGPSQASDIIEAEGKVAASTTDCTMHRALAGSFKECEWKRDVNRGVTEKRIRHVEFFLTKPSHGSERSKTPTARYADRRVSAKMACL